MTATASNRSAAKVVAITGAGRGIGAATARLLAANGARVVLGSRNEPELAAVAEGIVDDGGEVAFRRIDVTKPSDLNALVDLATQRFGRLDVLASIAGVAVNAPLASGELADWNLMIDVNLRGVLHGVAAALPVFRTQGFGHFVTVASTSAYKWVPGQAVYAASKSGARALCEVLRQELAPDGIRCTLVSPGFTDTDFIASTRDPDELVALTARRDAMAMPAQAVAETIAFAIAQPDSVDIGEVIVRPTVQP
ncbi:MAG TPA: SDR family oxidoreductase [Streptosporangiaceae bacterium]|jgi:NADP-dependent 3-hydroxy acid dehydrogenase YdfG